MSFAVVPHEPLPVVGPEAEPSGKPHPVMTFDPLHPQRLSIAPHSGPVEFSMHSPTWSQLPMAKKQEDPDGQAPPSPQAPTCVPASTGSPASPPPSVPASAPLSGSGG